MLRPLKKTRSAFSFTGFRCVRAGRALRPRRAVKAEGHSLRQREQGRKSRWIDATLSRAAPLPSARRPCLENSTRRPPGRRRTIRFGTAVGLSGPFVDGSKSTTISQYDLWAKRTNDAGGIMLSKYNKKVPVEIVYYDGRFDNNETIKLTEKLILDDKVEMILGPWGTQWNIVSAPITNKYEYPVIYTTAGDSILYTKANDWPYAFWSLSQPNEVGAADYRLACRSSRTRGRSKGAWPPSISASSSASRWPRPSPTSRRRPASSSSSTRAIRPTCRICSRCFGKSMATEPDAFFSFSYPPDTFLVTGQAQQLGFSPDIFYVLIGGVFPGYRDAFGADKVEGVFAYGGQDPDAPGYAEYAQAMKDTVQPGRRGRRAAGLCLPADRPMGDREGRRDRSQENPRRDRQGRPGHALGRYHLEEPAQRQSLGGRPVAGRADGGHLPGAKSTTPRLRSSRSPSGASNRVEMRRRADMIRPALFVPGGSPKSCSKSC